MVHGRGVASIRDTGRHLNHAGYHAHLAVRYSPAPTTFTRQVNQPGLSFF